MKLPLGLNENILNQVELVIDNNNTKKPKIKITDLNQADMTEEKA